MIREICKDPLLLGMPCETATSSDIGIACDLLETLQSHQKECVGMCANMIGIRKRIIAFADGQRFSVMFNPEIVKAELPYETEEGCLSLPGTRKTKRFRKIKVRWQDEKMQTREKSFEGWTAQILQHEIDHCNGIRI